MRKLFFRIALGLLMFGTVMMNAQSSQIWVSGVGDDTNPCSPTALCKTFTGAISKTVIGNPLILITKQDALIVVSSNTDIVTRVGTNDVTPHLYLGDVAANIDIQFFSGGNPSDDATITAKFITFNLGRELLDSELATDINDINTRKDITDTPNVVLLRTISSATAKTKGGEIKLPKYNDVARRWPTAPKANGVTRSTQTATGPCVCGGGFPPGGEPSATDIVAGISATVLSIGFANDETATGTIRLIPPSRNRT